jgi:hypothetical protein
MSVEMVPAVDTAYSSVLLDKIVQQTKRCIFNFENEKHGIGVQVPHDNLVSLGEVCLLSVV